MSFKPLPWRRGGLLAEGRCTPTSLQEALTPHSPRTTPGCFWSHRVPKIQPSQTESNPSFKPSPNAISSVVEIVQSFLCHSKLTVCALGQESLLSDCWVPYTVLACPWLASFCPHNHQQDGHRYSWLCFVFRVGITLLGWLRHDFPAAHISRLKCLMKREEKASLDLVRSAW